MIALDLTGDKASRVAQIDKIRAGIEGHRIDIQRGCGFRWGCSCGAVGEPASCVVEVLQGAMVHVESMRSAQPRPIP